MILYKKHDKGFTLIELITVIVILGVLSVGISGFIKFGSQIYAETSERDKIISSARFAIERLNRELRHALPNSVQLTNNNQCIEFTPIAVSTTYTDIPVNPEPVSNTVSVIRFDNSRFSDNQRVIVYPLTPSDVESSSGKVYEIATSGLDMSGGDVWEVTLDTTPIHFTSDSPTKRIFFISPKVSYCLTNNRLERDGIWMAQDITNIDPFDVTPATLQRNSIIQTRFRFEKNFEKITFNNEIQVPNVP